MRFSRLPLDRDRGAKSGELLHRFRNGGDAGFAPPSFSTAIFKRRA